MKAIWEKNSQRVCTHTHTHIKFCCTSEINTLKINYTLKKEKTITTTTRFPTLRSSEGFLGILPLLFAKLILIIPSSNISIKRFFKMVFCTFIFNNFWIKAIGILTLLIFCSLKLEIIYMEYFTSTTIKLSNFSLKSYRSFLLVF